MKKNLYDKKDKEEEYLLEIIDRYRTYRKNKAKK